MGIWTSALLFTQQTFLPQGAICPALRAHLQVQCLCSLPGHWLPVLYVVCGEEAQAAIKSILAHMTDIRLMLHMSSCSVSASVITTEVSLLLSLSMNNSDCQHPLNALYMQMWCAEVSRLYGRKRLDALHGPRISRLQSWETLSPVTVSINKCLLNSVKTSVYLLNRDFFIPWA